MKTLELSNGCEQLTAATASKALLGSLNDFVLKRFVQVTEVVTVSGYADDQFFVFLRVLLSFNRSPAVDNVELHMVSVHSKVGTNQSSGLSIPFSPAIAAGVNFWFSRVPPVSQ